MREEINGMSEIRKIQWFLLKLFIIMCLCGYILRGEMVHAYSITPNMSLKSPASGDTDYPTSISDSFSLIDTHDHSAGKGVTLGANSVGSTALSSNSVTVNKIATSATDASTIEVSSGVLRVKDAGITRAKLATANLVSSSNCGDPSGSDFTFSTNSSSLFDVINCSLTISTPGGRPILLALTDRGSATQTAQIASTASPASQCTVAFLRGSTVISRASFAAVSTQLSMGANYFYVDTSPSVGSNTYKVQASTTTGSATGCVLINLKLIAYEL